MKQNMFTITGLATVLLLASCKKNYTCNCTYTVLGFSQSVASDLGKQKKKDAESMCKSKETNITIPGFPGMNVTGTCTLN